MSTLGKLTVAALVERFSVAYRGARNARFMMGDVVRGLRSLGLSMKEVSTLLCEAFPHAKQDLGYVLSVPNLTAMLVLADTFQAQGGLSSPEGRYVVTREDMEGLPFTLPEMARLTEEATSKGGTIRLKDIVAAVSGPEKGRDKAIAKLREVITPTVKVTDRLQDMNLELTAINAEIERLTKKRDALREAIAAEKLERASAPAPVVDAQPAVVKSPVARRPRPQQVASVTA